jgi:uncharacterized protein (TIGR00255 family)
MTGFGRGENAADHLQISIDLRSVNSRYLEIQFRMPGALNALEKYVRDEIKRNIKRGKITASIDLKENHETGAANHLDEALLQNKYRSILKAAELLNIPPDIKIEHLLQFESIFKLNLQDMDEASLKKVIKPALNAAINQLNKMRKQEGENLLNDIKIRVKKIAEYMHFIREKSVGNVQKEFDRLYQNAVKLISENKIDRDRFENEIAILADKVDITEECVRMESHLDLLKKSFKSNAEAGKKITFILQEMLREANTINSKTSEIEILHEIIKIKEEIEKVREQAQNLE